jgi:hypothetical protein
VIALLAEEAITLSKIQVVRLPRVRWLDAITVIRGGTVVIA